MAIEREDGVDLDIQEVREDFEHIWSKNLVKVTIIKHDDSQAGDYFREDEDSGEVKNKIWLNIQGRGALHYERKEHGITTAGQRFHAYSQWNENVDNKDIIEWAGKRFKVENHDAGIYDGQFVFQEFDLVRVDKVD